MTSQNELTLKQTTPDHLEHLFRFQLDEEGGYLAAFMPQNHADKTAYLAKMTPLLSNPTVNTRTIYLGDTIVGSVAKFEMEGEAEITYWTDRQHWGNGITTRALQQFLAIEHTRPLHARVAFDNYGSQRVLEKCGFLKVGTDKGFASARGMEIEEFVYRLG
jgi:ribosomal-protein-alanine N-acetyltransferase